MTSLSESVKEAVEQTKQQTKELIQKIEESAKESASEHKAMLGDVQSLQDALASLGGGTCTCHSSPSGDDPHARSMMCHLTGEIANRRQLPEDVENTDRGRLIRTKELKWMNGSTLTYSFFRSGRYAGSFDTSATIQIMRDAFKVWEDVGIGIKFKEVGDVNDAMIRIGFLARDGFWSYLGRDILTGRGDPRTMNIEADLTERFDTAIHEIGHTLGFNHEHQNPNAGIVWDEQAVYTAFRNNSRRTIFNNILRKIPANEVDGSTFDRDSIMSYDFPAGLIVSPASLRNGFTPKPGLSEVDKKTVLDLYPPVDETKIKPLVPFQTVEVDLDPGSQQTFTIEPEISGRYRVRTLGRADTVIELSEEIKGGERKVLADDDDSGFNLNAKIEEDLFQGRKYFLNLRLYSKTRSGVCSVLLEEISEN